MRAKKVRTAAQERKEARPDATKCGIKLLNYPDYLRHSATPCDKMLFPAKAALRHS
jgi:hypothetical protein